jgi:hypothetical protein
VTARRVWGDGDGRGVALHDRTVDRLLAGTLDPGDVPPEYEGVAELMRVATGPAAPDELRDEDAAVAALIGGAPAARPSRPGPTAAPPVVAPVRSHPAVPATAPAGRWTGRWARAAAVAVVVLVGAGGGLAALLGGEKRPPAVSADPAPDRDRTATIQGTQGPPLSEPTTTVPTTVVRPPASAPLATSPPPAPASATAPPPAPAPTALPAPVGPPPASGVPPTTAPPLPEECADIERLPAGMREGLDGMARGFGFPSFAEMCRVGAQYSSPTSSGGATGGDDWWSGSSSRRR